MDCLIALGQWAVELLQCTASLPRVVGSATLAMHCRIAPGQRAWNTCNTVPHHMAAVGRATPAMHYLTA